MPLGMLAWLGWAATAVGAAPPPNDNFANAIAIPVGYNSWGTVTGTNASATAEPGEPAHAGLPAAQSVWYSWTAPSDGTIHLDAFNSSFTARLAVYTGTVLSNLSVVAASDFNAPSASVPAAPVNGNLGGVRFSASAGTTYYIAVDTERGTAGPFVLNWTYHSSGLFRFTSAAYICAETESRIDGQHGGDDVQQHTVLGMVVTITRLFGSDGRVAVNYTTTTNVNVPATDNPGVPDTDFRSVSGQLVFENQEMSRSFVVPIIYDGGLPQPDRVFGVILTNVALGPNEFTTLVSPPRIDSLQSTSTVTVLDVDVDPREPVAPDGSIMPSNAIVNFEKSAFRVSRGAGYGDHLRQSLRHQRSQQL